jgi:hypothetical protein
MWSDIRDSKYGIRRDRRMEAIAVHNEELHNL